VLEITGTDLALTNPYQQGGTLGSNAKDLIVTFIVGGADTTNPDGTINTVGGKDVTIDSSTLTMDSAGDLFVPVPPGAQLAGTYITVTRPMNLPLDGSFKRQLIVSNQVQLIPSPQYVFAANGGDDTVSMINAGL